MDNLLISDKEIQVSKSPFSAFEGEELKFDGSLTPYGFDHAARLLKRGFILASDFVILEALLELEYATSRMVTMYLNVLRNILVDQSKVRRRLKFLNKNNIIGRYKFNNTERNNNTRGYFLEKSGNLLLKSRDYPTKWKVSNSLHSLPVVKGILARNQVLFAFLTNHKEIEYFINPLLQTERGDEYSGTLSLTRKGKGLLFETVRSYEGYEKRILQKLNMYKRYFSDFKTTSKILDIPPLIIIGEDDGHLLEIYRLILKEEISLKNTQILYTTDLRILKDFNDSILDYQIVDVEGKYKVKISQIALNF